MPSVSTLQLQRFRHGRLHARGHFIRPNAGPQLGVVGIVDTRQAIEAAQQTELGFLFLRLHARRRSDERQRRAAADVQANAGMVRSEVRRPVRPRTAAAIPGRSAEHHVFGQVLVERSQAIGDPGADGREGPLADGGRCAR